MHGLVAMPTTGPPTSSEVPGSVAPQSDQTSSCNPPWFLQYTYNTLLPEARSTLSHIFRKLQREFPNYISDEEDQPGLDPDALAELHCRRMIEAIQRYPHDGTWPSTVTAATSSSQSVTSTEPNIKLSTGSDSAALGPTIAETLRMQQGDHDRAMRTLGKPRDLLLALVDEVEDKIQTQLSAAPLEQVAGGSGADPSGHAQMSLMMERWQISEARNALEALPIEFVVRDRRKKHAHRSNASAVPLRGPDGSTVTSGLGLCQTGTRTHKLRTGDSSATSISSDDSALDASAGAPSRQLLSHFSDGIGRFSPAMQLSRSVSTDSSVRKSDSEVTPPATPILQANDSSQHQSASPGPPPIRSHRVLVLGDSGAGKSTFINRFLGVQLMPSLGAQTTAVICEIAYGRVPRLLLSRRMTGNEIHGLNEQYIDHMMEWGYCGFSARNSMSPEADAYTVEEGKDHQLSSQLLAAWQAIVDNKKPIQQPKDILQPYLTKDSQGTSKEITWLRARLEWPSPELEVEDNTGTCYDSW